MKWLRLAPACAAIVYLGSCSLGAVLEPAKDPSQFFVLTAIDASARGVPITYSGTSGAKEIDIGLGPVNLPAYLARPEMVTRSSPNQVDLSEINRWAEPLDKNFVSVLGQNLMILLGAHVTTFPWYRPTTLDYQITVDVTRFDTDKKGTAEIFGRWEIKDPNNGGVLKSSEINITDPAHSGESQAATLSRALGDLSGQLADAVRATPHPPPRLKD